MEYRAACRRANTLIKASRNKFRYQRVVGSIDNPRRMGSAVKDLLHTDHPSETDRLSTDDITAFCSTLASFFINKVLNIKLCVSSVLVSFNHDPLAFDQVHSGSSLSYFAPVTDIGVERLIDSMSAKSSPLDFVQTSVIEACRGTFAHIIANLSFDNATFPTRFKTAQVTLFIKKCGLDKNDPAN